MHNVLKYLLAIVFIAISPCEAQQAASERKPPFGIPTDAKWFNGKWYRVYTEKKINWQDARGKCATLRGQLAIVPDEATWSFLKQLAPGPMLWLGGTDEQTTGVWKWVDGSPVTFKAWNRGEPDNWHGIQHYMCAHGTGWDDIQKDGGGKDPNSSFHVVGYICEWKEKP